MRNYTIKLNNNQYFEQIASDGGLLNEPVKMNEIQLTPSEREEIIVDFSQFKTDEDVKLVMDDGTVLLPFKVSEKETEKEREIEQPKNPVVINDEVMQKPESKKLI